MAKKKLQGLVQWGEIYQELSLNKCPKCSGYLENLKPLGFYLSVCQKCKIFWSLKAVDVTGELHKDFIRNNLKNNDTKQ